MSVPHRIEECRHCKEVTGWTYKKRGSSKHHFQIGLVCDKCNRLQSWAGGRLWTAKAKVLEEVRSIDDLEWHITEYPLGYGACQICGDMSDHEHHYGPKWAFGEEEAEKWPKGYLCVPCHTRWHSMVDNYGEWKRKQSNAEQTS